MDAYEVLEVLTFSAEDERAIIEVLNYNSAQEEGE